MRKGFTLIEALVALVIFEFGMLAIVATSAATARDLMTANRRAHALAIGRDRAAQLRAAACTAPSAGARRAGGDYLEIWRVESLGSGRVITDSVVFAVARGRRTSIVARAATVCP